MNIKMEIKQILELHKNYQEFIIQKININEVPILEVFKQIKGFENYEVSNRGIVRQTKSNLIVKHYSNKLRYCTVYIHNKGNKKNAFIHRLVAEAFILNPSNKEYVDHINGITNDNHISNLRWATNTENQHNSKLNKNSTTGIKGVTYRKDKNKYQARISIDGIEIHLGYFITLEDAKQARIIKANAVFGEYVNACEKL